MAPQRRPIRAWRKTAHLTDANWDESRFATNPETGAVSYWGEPARGPWIGFNRVPTSTGEKVNVEVLLNYDIPPRIVGIRLNVPLTVETFRSLPLDAIRRAASKARPLLWEHSDMAGDLLPEELAPEPELSQIKPYSDEHLDAVYRIFQKGRSEGGSGTAAVMKTAGIPEKTAQRWVSRARKKHDPSLNGEGIKKKGQLKDGK